MKTNRHPSLRNLLALLHRLTLCLPLLAATASADETRTIPGTANIYGAGHAAPPTAGFGGSGTLPPGFGFAAGPGKTLSIVSATGTVTLDKMTNNAGIGPSSPDGNAFYAPTDVASTGGLSGIKANVTGFLAGVFLTASEPLGGGPPVLDFTSAGRGTNFTNLAPQIGQVFFIGNGLNSLGGAQQFSVPATATRLFVGIVDAADGDNAAGPPQAYDDNGGAFTATMRIEPKVTRLFYLRYNNVYLMNADGSSKTNLTNSLFYAEHGALDSEGKYIAFRGSRGAPGPGGVTLMGVWVMKAEPVSASNQPVLVTNNLNYGYNFSWHPDGEYLAMGHYVNNKPQATVLRVRNSAGTITPESAGNPAVQMTLGTDGDFYSGGNFSPDGRYLGMSCKGRQIAVLRAFDTAGMLTPESTGNPVVKLGTLNPLFTIGTPEWSPDGKRLVFPQVQADDSNHTNPRSMLATLAVRNAAGTLTPEALTNPKVRITTPMTGSYSTTSPSWSADGSRIAFEEKPSEFLKGNVITIGADAPESPLTNPRVPLTTSPEGGGAGPRFAVARIVDPAAFPKFTLALFGLKNNQLLPPKTAISLRADPTPSQIPGVTIKQVQFHVDGKPVGSPDMLSPFNYNTTVISAGKRVVTAVATDSLGRTVTSPALTFTVTPAGAGQIALQTEISPDGDSFAPGQLVTFSFLATNTSKTATAKDVKITAPVPDDTTYNNANSYDENGGKIRPSPDVSANKKSVTFSLGDIPVGKTRRAKLTVRVPFDAREGRDPIRNDDVIITGIGFGGQPFKGEFNRLSRPIVGAPPKNSPRLALLKTAVNREGDSEDVIDIVDDPKLGPVHALAHGEKITIFLLAMNYGGSPAERVFVTDRIPEGFQLVPNSARVGTKAAGGVFSVEGRSIEFSFGDFQKGEALAISYQLKVLERSAGGPPLNAVVNSVNAEISSRSLRGQQNSIPEKMPIRIVGPVALVAQNFAIPPQSEVGKPTTYILKYRNEGGRKAKDVQIIAELPAGTNFRSAKVAQPTNQSFKATVSGKVIFNLGDIGPDSGDEVELVVNVTSAVAEMKEPSLTLRTNIDEADSPSPRSLPVPDRNASLKENGPLPLLSTVDPEFNRLRSKKIPRIGMLKSAPSSVQPGGIFTYTFTVINHSPIEANGTVFGFDIPAGAEYVSSSKGKPLPSDPRNFSAFLSDIAPHSSTTISVTLRATGKAGTDLREIGAVAFSQTSAPVWSLASSTLIIQGDASAADNQAAIARAQLDVLGLDSTSALADPQVRARLAAIHNDSVSFRVSAIDYLQLTNGSLLIPAGKGYLVAAGAGNLVAAGAGNLVAAGGGNLVAAGAGNLIQFSGLVGNDGASLVGLDGSTIMSQLVAAGGGNLVAAGAGNLVAAGGGNLIGMDGASLIGLDGASFKFNHLVAAGGGNLVAAGAGNLVLNGSAGLVAAGGGNLKLANPAGLVAAGGGNLVAAGGGNLVAAGGGNIVSSDASRAAAIGKNGAFIAGGGGSPLVAAGGGN